MRDAPLVETYPSRDRWLEQRRGGLGSSDAPVILGLSRWKSPLTLYHEKLGAPFHADESSIQELGLLMEPVIATLFARETHREVRDAPTYSLYRHPDHLWMTASIDRWQWDPSRIPEVHASLTPDSADDLVAAGTGVLELKTANDYVAHEWLDEGEVPLPYRVQLQHQLAVTGAEWGSIAALIGGVTFRWTDIPRDDEFIALLRAEEEAFWSRLLTQTPPVADGSASTHATLRALHPETSPTTSVSLPPAFIDLDARREQVRAELADATREFDGLTHQIQQYLVTHHAQVGVLSTGVRYTWHLQTRTDPPRPEPKITTFPVLRRKAPKP